MIDKDQRCKGCGAPIRGRTCEYCGRVFVAEHTTDTVLYANDIHIIGVEKLSSTLDSLQYQVSQERQIAFLQNVMKAMNNVFPLQPPIERVMETRWEKCLRRCR